MTKIIVRTASLLKLSKTFKIFLQKEKWKTTTKSAGKEESNNHRNF